MNIKTINIGKVVPKEATRTKNTYRWTTNTTR